MRTHDTTFYTVRSSNNFAIFNTKRGAEVYYETLCATEHDGEVTLEEETKKTLRKYDALRRKNVL
jgi:hypothetical protein